MLFALFVQSLFAQDRTVSGIVTDELGAPLFGVNVNIKGENTGTQTETNGSYSIKVSSSKIIVFSFMGMKTQEITAANTIINVKMTSNATELEGVVITAQGIKRDKKSLGYATQKIEGSDLNGGVSTNNVTNLLSGKAAGVEIRRNTNFGGSTNIIIRGSKSMTGNNQALWVIDGIPLDNSNSNSSSQQQGGGGYDYGNNASDINQEDIESINILKGAAATALYGSRAANGVVLVTTKKGKKRANQGIGVSYSSSYSVGKIDKSTFPTYQNKYGAGYGIGSSFLGTGTPDTVDTTNDASYGNPFNGQLVYQWDAFTPYSPNFGKATPWQAAANGPASFFKNSTTASNSVTIESANDKSNFSLSFSNLKQTGTIVNSTLAKNQISAKFSQKVTDKLTSTSYAAVTLQNTVGRNSTGYNDNIMTSFRQWWETNVDVKALENAYNASGGQNVTWNWKDPTSASGLKPIYWDNPYFTRYQNFSSDNRNRLIGYSLLNYELTKWISVMGRVSIDTYQELQEERRAVGSVPLSFGLSPSPESSGYQRTDKSYKEMNYDLIININKKFGPDFSLAGVIGSNARRQNVDRVINSTMGGLVVANLYALSNSRNPIPFPIETKYNWGVNGVYAQASLGYKDTYFIESSVRRDASSTLPVGNNVYVYPAISGSLILSNLIKKDWLNFGKIRANYAEVGNDTSPLSLENYLSRSFNFNNQVSYSYPNTASNANLKPEKTRSMEFGLEGSLLKRRLGFDVSYYRNTSINQIVSGAVSSASNFTNAIVNGGEILNKGLEVQLTATPVKLNNFQWDVTVNWSTNKNTVVSLPGGLDNLQLGSFQGGVTINATPGEAYGAIKGTDYLYVNGQKVVDQTNGQYMRTTSSDVTIGNITPKWIGGIRNRISYKNIALSFLIDTQKGGDIFSLDMYYGMATGIYPETAVGNIRSTGTVLPGVAPNGTPNSVSSAPGGAWNNNIYGYTNNPNKAFIYDASFIKLREISITYQFPRKFLDKSFIKDAKLSLVGTNVWIIHKNIPYADPESGLTSGNLSRGYSAGSLPTTREIGLNLNFKF